MLIIQAKSNTPFHAKKSIVTRFSVKSKITGIQTTSGIKVGFDFADGTSFDFADGTDFDFTEEE